MEKEYELACELYGVKGRCWDMLYTSYSPSVFCPANRKSIISEYLFWEDFKRRANRKNFIYYWGIDEFLKVYHDAVYSCLTNIQ